MSTADPTPRSWSALIRELDDRKADHERASREEQEARAREEREHKMAREAHWAEYIALIRRRNDMGETLRRAWDDESRAVYGESLRKAQAALDAFEASCEPETKPTPAWDAGWDGWGR